MKFYLWIELVVATLYVDYQQKQMCFSLDIQQEREKDAFIFVANIRKFE
jgi:hypothetical protein